MINEENNQPLPKGWRLEKLGKIARIKPDNGIFKRRHEFGKGVPLINILDLFKSIEIDLTTCERVEVTSNELNKYEVSKGDLFFCRSSLKREGIGWCCYAENITEPSVFECHIIRVRLNPEVAFYKYVAHYWRLPEVREKVIGRATTSTMTTINQFELSEIEIPIPPTIEEQRRIATILDEQMKAVEEARFAVEAQLEAVKKLPAALLRKAFAGEI